VNGRHRIPDHPDIASTLIPAVALVQRLTGVSVADSTPTRHDGSQPGATPVPSGTDA
jgi:hypothetical protein